MDDAISVDGLDRARALLGPWVEWGNLIAAPAAAILLTVLAATIVILVGRPRGPAPKAWPAQAARTWPLRVALTRLGLAAPIAGALIGAALAGPLGRTPRLALGALGFLSAFAASHAIAVVVRSRLGRGRFSEGSTAAALLHLLVSRYAAGGGLVLIAWGVDRRSPVGAAFAAFGAVLLFSRVLGLDLMLARATGAAVEATPRLVALVDRARADIPASVVRTTMLRWNDPAAFANPLLRSLIVTEGMMELPDDELVAVLRHELAHLTEGRGHVARRLVPIAVYAGGAVLWGILARPLGLVTVVVIGLAIVAATTVFVTHARALEQRADAVAAEADGAALARALEHLHELAQLPTGRTARSSTHPTLDDRVRAAGVEPRHARVDVAPRRQAMLGAAAVAVVFVATVAGWMAAERSGLPGVVATGGSRDAVRRLAHQRLGQGRSCDAGILYRVSDPAYDGAWLLADCAPTPSEVPDGP